MEFNCLNRYKRILIVTAVDAERDAVMRGLSRAGADMDKLEVIAAGVGPASAAAGTAIALAKTGAGYGLVISAGIGGGFAGVAELGTVVVSSEIIAADLGAETPDGYLSVDELGFGSARLGTDRGLAERLAAEISAAGIPAVAGPVLTVSTATGTAETAAAHAARTPGAAAEAMEGFGVATAARQCGIPVLEIRAISNAVGPRDRAAWRIKEALQALEAAFAILSSEVSPT